MKKARKRRAIRPVPAAHDESAAFAARLSAGSSAHLYTLRLFVTGSSPHSSSAVAMIRAICDEHLAGKYELEVVDIYQQPAAVVGEQIIAAPTLIKRKPAPVRRMVGSLADRERLLAGLDLPPDRTAPSRRAAQSTSR